MLEETDALVPFFTPTTLNPVRGWLANRAVIDALIGAKILDHEAAEMAGSLYFARSSHSRCSGFR
jgi:hypothetical protein